MNRVICPHCGRAYNPEVRRRNEQIALDYRSGLTLAEVARRHKLSIAYVHKVLDRAGVPRRHPVWVEAAHERD